MYQIGGVGVSFCLVAYIQLEDRVSYKYPFNSATLDISFYCKIPFISRGLIQLSNWFGWA